MTLIFVVPTAFFMAFTLASSNEDVPSAACQANGEEVQGLPGIAAGYLYHNEVDGNAVGISQREDPMSDASSSDLYEGQYFDPSDVNFNERGTALMNAAWNGHVQVVKLLIDNGADVNAIDNEGGTALINASWNGHEYVDPFDIDGSSDLMNAAYKGDHRAVHLAILRMDDSDFDVNAVDPDEESFLTIAAENGYSEV